MENQINQPPQFTPENIKKLVRSIQLFVFMVLLDLISKNYAISLLSEPLQIFPWFHLQLEKNTGIAFSIAIPQLVLIPLNLLIFVGLIYFLIKKTKPGNTLAMFLISLLAAGAVGNLLDRFRYGYVIDFISFWNFPVFNLADAYISVSVFLLIVFYDRIKRSN